MKIFLNVFFNVTFLMGLLCSAHAQKTDYCGFAQAVDQMEQKYPGYQDAIDYTIEKAQSKASKRSVKKDSILRIPVVVHIVHENATENLNDSLVHSQIEVLNQDFRRNNPDTVDTRPVFDTLAGDAGIEFYLAKKDPSGDSTTGITRTQTTKSSFFNIIGGIQSIDEIKSDADGGKSPWPTNEYLNMWVGDVGGAVLGFAYPPVGAPDSMWSSGQLPNDSSVSGVVVHYEAFGKNNPLTTGPQLGRADEGGTAVHEVGHYLGLRHISGDGDCTADDYIDDTPIQNGPGGGLLGGGHHQSCAYGTNTCVDSIDTPIDYPDMFGNYMDYAPDSCTNLFTHDQIALMRSMIINERSSLYKVKNQRPSSINSSNAPSHQVKVAPNPTRNQVSIRFSLQQRSNISLDLFNTMGKHISHESQDEVKNGRQVIDLSDQPRGIYHLRIHTAENVITKKVIRQ